MTEQPANVLDALMDIKSVSKVLSRSRASIYRDIQAGIFPKPVKNQGSARWRTSQVRDFMDSLSPE